MANKVVVGVQWGDEGKGKIVDWLTQKADIVIRFQGGHNAGHTLVIDGEVYALSLLPSGIVHPATIGVIGHGVVLDPWALCRELDDLAGRGFKIGPDRLKIADTASLILPFHAAIDQARERAKGKALIGTTGRGIGPAYEDKVARRALRVGDLFDLAACREHLNGMVMYHNAVLRSLGEAEVDVASVFESLEEITPRLLPFCARVWEFLAQASEAGQSLLFEGAQGSLLDVDQGTYPYVTSSNTVAGQAAVGSGVGPSMLGYILGVTKAYTTRVGSGPFPTELKDGVGQRLGERGGEVGTVTGRKRRCGWLDAVLLRQAGKINGLSGLALTKLDVLDGLDELKICTAYDVNGERIDYFPTGLSEATSIRPVYETWPGWSQATRGIRHQDQLPKAALNYIRRIEEFVQIPISLISTGPERHDIILVDDF